MEKYELQIVSHHPDFDGKTLRQYNIDGIPTLGSYGDEPFEIRFKNNTWNKVQVKISVDGTCTSSGEPATTEPTGDMWVVNPYGTLTLKAWKESDDGGAAFIFTYANNSVAAHTHGDLSCKGIIAAAVFEEGLPITVVNVKHQIPGCFGFYYTSTYTYPANWPANLPHVVPTSYNEDKYRSNVTDTKLCDCNTSSLNAGPACGAGSYVEQKVAHVHGLIKPVFTETVKVRYIWWEDLQAKLREQHNAPSQQPSGFPGDKPRGINLGSTPRIGSVSAAPRRVEQTFNRV